MNNSFEAEEVARGRFLAISQPLTDAERERLEILEEQADARGSLRERIVAKFSSLRFGADAFYENYDAFDPEDAKEEILMEARLSAYLR